MTHELRNEGFAREFVNRIQNLRKDSGLEVTDRISISFAAEELLSSALREMTEYIKRETLAVDVKEGIVPGGNAIQDDINGEKCEISIQKILA
jgi:isoleucyl-tRNA synthetase